MPRKKKEEKEYVVSVYQKVSLSVVIRAFSLEEAKEKARKQDWTRTDIFNEYVEDSEVVDVKEEA